MCLPAWSQPAGRSSRSLRTAGRREPLLAAADVKPAPRPRRQRSQDSSHGQRLASLSPRSLAAGAELAAPRASVACAAPAGHSRRRRDAAPPRLTDRETTGKHSWPLSGVSCGSPSHSPIQPASRQSGSSRLCEPPSGSCKRAGRKRGRQSDFRRACCARTARDESERASERAIRLRASAPPHRLAWPPSSACAARRVHKSGAPTTTTATTATGAQQRQSNSGPAEQQCTGGARTCTRTTTAVRARWSAAAPRANTVHFLCCCTVCALRKAAHKPAALAPAAAATALATRRRRRRRRRCCCCCCCCCLPLPLRSIPLPILFALAVCPAGPRQPPKS
jgi:hypothetical protein